MEFGSALFVRRWKPGCSPNVDAINAVAVSRAGRTVSQVQGELEEIPDAKARLVTLLSEARLPYDAKVCAEIAQHVNIERLRYRCPSFRLFQTKVLDC